MRRLASHSTTPSGFWKFPETRQKLRRIGISCISYPQAHYKNMQLQFDSKPCLHPSTLTHSLGFWCPFTFLPKIDFSKRKLFCLSQGSNPHPHKFKVKVKVKAQSTNQFIFCDIFYKSRNLPLLTRPIYILKIILKLNNIQWHT